MRHVRTAGIVLSLVGLLLLSSVLALADCGCQTGGQRIGAICKDGTKSSSIGSGTCSHHGGVAYWLYAPVSRLVISAGADVKLTSVTPVVLTATATGSASPYTFLWNPGGARTQSITVALPGTYTVTVRDANGCACSDSVTVTADRGTMLGGSHGSWYVKTEIDPGGSLRAVTLFLFATEGKGSLGERVALALTCRNGVTAVLIGWWTPLGSTASVTWSVGDNPSKTALWPLSADKTATSYPQDGIEFIQNLFGSSSLVAQVTPYGGRTITAKFDTSGLTEAIQPLCRACGWPHSVPKPDAPVGPTAGSVGQVMQFSTGVVACSHGHPVELSFDWGAGTASEWSSASSWFKSWAREGTYHVRVRARCVSDTRVVSDWSEPLAVTVTRE